MKALIYKDIYTLRIYLLKQGLMMMGMYLCLSIFMKTFTFFSSMAVMTFVMLMLSSFNLDEAAHVNTYVLTMPVDKRDIVRGKYAIMMGMLVIGAICCGLVGTLFDMVSFRNGAIEIWATNIAVTAVYLLTMCLILPIFLTLPAEKARIWMTLSMLVPFFLVMGFGEFFQGTDILQNLPWGAIGVGAVLFLIVAVVASYNISLQLIRRKEF